MKTNRRTQSNRQTHQRWVYDRLLLDLYRDSGDAIEPRILPRSIRHAIFMRNGKLYYVHLTVIYAKHQEEVRADQIRVIKGIIRE